MNTATPGRAALALDHLLTELKPDQIEILAHAAGKADPALFDQLAAAARDTRAAFAAIVTERGGTLTRTHSAGVPEWVRLTSLETLVRWFTGRAATCLHAPHPSRPQPVHATAWRPGLVTCLPCAPTLFRLSGADDRRCDHCGTVADVIHPHLIALGAMSFAFGLCPNCAVPTTEDSTA